ncbi:MAG: UDP-N-acetylmuramoyl-L-alanyl-D-glutamate--2,6-diaminopimelate ligase [Alphaproteobacteria bacterium]|nr:UDP-N-acetylmuramoyl-L-alanyl-D-glutamate--2,6-diaminopimelate ligase [Alphaproteobacteria bacterium]
MRLLELIGDADGVTVSNRARAAEIEITGLTADSREVRAGYLFAAFPGNKVDGRDFIADAIARGATAILAPEGLSAVGLSAVVVTDTNPRQRFAHMAATYFGRQMETVVAVTGTNGKSSTVNFCRQIWQSMDHAAASLGTIGIIAPGINRAGSLTTPDPVTLHSEIAELEAAGVTHLAIEASSQGMDQYRLDGLKISAAGFTNLTRDHLDYHGTMEKYFESKARLFSEMIASDGIAVINADSDYAGKVRAVCEKRGLRVIDFGANATDIRLVRRKPLPGGQFMELQLFGERYELELPLVGDFQAANALCALGLVIAEDPDDRGMQMRAVYALEKLQSVRGRLEYANAKRPTPAYAE